jgi:hypothetical protein
VEGGGLREQHEQAVQALDQVRHAGWVHELQTQWRENRAL